MIRTIIAAAALCGGALFNTAGAQSPAPASTMAPADDQTVVATVNGEEITGGDVAMFYRSLPPQYQQMPMESLYSQLIERLIDQKLIASAAHESGLADRPEVKARLEMLREGMLNQIYMEERIRERVTEEKLRDAYQKKVALEPKRQEVRARHILVKTKEEAAGIIDQIDKGADFAALAKEKSTGPSGRNGGDLGFFAEGQMVPPFSEAAFALKKGEVTPEPIKTQFGWHVIKVEDRRVSGARRYEEMEGELRQEITSNVFEKEVEALRSKADIDVKGQGGSKIQPLR